MRRWGFIVLAAFAAFAVTACDPSETSGRRDGVNLEVLVNADGSGTAQMYLDGATRSDAELRELGKAAGSRLFPEATTVSVRVDPNSGGSPFVVIDAQDLYQPGPQPKVSLDTRDAVGWLLDNGKKTVDVYIDSPRVPQTSSWTPPRGADEVTWVWTRISTASAAPYGFMVLTPQPWLGFIPVLLTLAAAVLLVVSFVVFRRTRRRLVPMLLCLGALLAAGAIVVYAGAVLPNNLGVAGILTSTWVNVASAVSLVSLLLAPAAIALLVFYLVRKPSRRVPVTAVEAHWPPPAAD